jgi:hypothetical protein
MPPVSLLCPLGIVAAGKMGNVSLKLSIPTRFPPDSHAVLICIGTLASKLTKVALEQQVFSRRSEAVRRAAVRMIEEERLLHARKLVKVAISCRSTKKAVLHGPGEGSLPFFSGLGRSFRALFSFPFWATDHPKRYRSMVRAHIGAEKGNRQIPDEKSVGFLSGDRDCSQAHLVAGFDPLARGVTLSLFTTSRAIGTTRPGRVPVPIEREQY